MSQCRSVRTSVGAARATAAAVLGATSVLATLVPGCAGPGQTATLRVDADCFGYDWALIYQVSAGWAGYFDELPPGYELCAVVQREGYAVCEYCAPDDPSAPRFAAVNCEAPYRMVPPLVAKGPAEPTCIALDAEDVSTTIESIGGILDPAQFAMTQAFVTPTELLLAPAAPFGVSVRASDATIDPTIATRVAPGARVEASGPAAAVIGWLAASGAVGGSVETVAGRFEVAIDPAYPIAATYLDGERIDVRWIDPAAIEAEAAR